tara:strand:+ start:741 stop:1670 length:930 start_codon:yes stop_codon:yes gene_type:complete
MDHIRPHLKSFLPFAQKRLGFNKPPYIFFDSDVKNSQNVLGKTGYYDPESLEIVIFTDKRHPKDILRSLSHELVHHSQNCRGDLEPQVAGETGSGYAQENPHMREMEREAYEKGNLCFRDWEDSVKFQISLKLQLQETNYLHIKGDTHKMATYDALKEQIIKKVVHTLREKINNPGKYMGSEKQKAGIDDDGDGVPDGADAAPDDGSVQERRKRDTPRDSPRREAAKLKVNEEEEDVLNEKEEELEERKKRSNPRNDRGIPQRLKEVSPPEEDPEDVAARKEMGEEEEAPLEEWYQRELYEKLTTRWTK